MPKADNYMQSPASPPAQPRQCVLWSWWALSACCLRCLRLSGGRPEPEPDQVTQYLQTLSTEDRVGRQTQLKYQMEKCAIKSLVIVKVSQILFLCFEWRNKIDYITLSMFNKKAAKKCMKTFFFPNSNFCLLKATQISNFVHWNSSYWTCGRNKIWN